MVKICVSRREYEHKNGYKTCRIEIRVAYSSHLVFRVEGWIIPRYEVEYPSLFSCPTTTNVHHLSNQYTTSE